MSDFQQVKEVVNSVLPLTALPKEFSVWLVEQAEKAEQYEEALLSIQDKLKSGGNGTRTHVSNTVNEALSRHYIEKELHNAKQ